MKYIFKIVSSLVFVFFTASCALLAPTENFNDLRFQFDQLPVVNNEPLNLYIANIMNKICKSENRKSLTVVIADTADIQAMSYVETGTIYVSRGMLYAIQNEAELVVLLSHEVGHYQLRHGLNDVQNQNEADALSQISNIFEGVAGASLSDNAKKYLEKIRQAQFSQKNEDEADEFAIVLANRLGYSVDAFASLFDRLSQLDSKNIVEKINSVSGTHRSLSDRAQHVRDFMKAKNIASFQKIDAEKYLKAVSRIVKLSAGAAIATKSESVKKTEFQLEILNQKISNLHQKKSTLSVEEFLKYMTELRSAATDLKILDQIQPQSSLNETEELSDSDPQDADEFMMELIRLEKPLWISDANVINLKNALANLSQMGVRFLPVAGDAIDLYELLIGKNYFTGDVLSFGERAATALGVIAGSGANWRTAVDGLGGFKNIHGISAIDPHKISEAVIAAKEAIEGAPILGRPAKSLTKEITSEEISTIEKKYRLIKNEKNFDTLKTLAHDMSAKNIPDDWVTKVTKVSKKDHKLQGLEYIHPEHTDVRIRVSPGNPMSKYPNSQKPYVRQTIQRKSFDKFGKALTKESESSHIPLDEYKFINFWGDYDKK